MTDIRGGCHHFGPNFDQTQIKLDESAWPDEGLPTIAIVGRPNVGKSTLFNKIVGSRRAIVGDEPGITRDRLYGNAEWLGRKFRVVDTGGIIPEDKDFIPSEIFRQAKVALEEAAAVVMVVDARTELTGPDMELARLLIKSGKPVFLAINKIDSDKQERLVDEFHRLGIKKYFPVSAEHGRGVDDLLDAVLETFPEINRRTEDYREASDRPRQTDATMRQQEIRTRRANPTRPEKQK